MKKNRRDFIKNTLIFSMGAGNISNLAGGAGTENRLINEIRAHNEGMAIWWTGHNGWLIKSGGILIGTDLALESKARAVPSPVSAAELAPELDFSFVTHEHSDHFERETSKILLEQGNCKFVLPESCLDAARKEIKIPDDRIQIAIPRKSFDMGNIHIDPVRAIHGNEKYAVYYDANMQDCGYVITIDGNRIFQVGDSVLTEDQLFAGHVDVLFFSPTEHNTFIDRSVILINTLNPQYIFPQHRDTFKVTAENRFWTSAYPYEVKIRLSQEMQARYYILGMGEKKMIV